MIFDVLVNQKLQRQNTKSDSEIKLNKNGCNFFNTHEELKCMWVENLAAGTTFLEAHAVRMQTLIKY